MRGGDYKNVIHGLCGPVNFSRMIVHARSRPIRFTRTPLTIQLVSMVAAMHSPVGGMVALAAQIEVGHRANADRLPLRVDIR